MPSDIYIYNVYITPVILQPVLVKRFTMRLDKCSPISCWHNSHLQMLQEQICFFLTKLSRTIKIRSSQTPIVKLKMSVKNQFLYSADFKASLNKTGLDFEQVGDSSQFSKFFSIIVVIIKFVPKLLLTEPKWQNCTRNIQPR